MNSSSRFGASQNVRKLVPYVFHSDSMKNLKLSAILLTASKLFGLLSPFILRRLVNSMAVTTAENYAIQASGAAALSTTTMIAGPRLKFFTAALALITWGTTRVLASGLFEFHMMKITEVIQDSLKRISTKSFDHLHKLDLNYHKI